MSKPTRIDPAELLLTDGQRTLGRLVAKGNGWEVFGPDGGYLFKCETLQEARQAVIQRGREGSR